MVRYYCSGFDINDAFGHGLGEMFKKELKGTKKIVFIPGRCDEGEKARNKYVPIFMDYFERVGIHFESVELLCTKTSIEDAKTAISRASFIMLMGGDPFEQKKLCEILNIMDDLKSFNGIMMGFSAGAMLMSRHIIITPCSEEYPDFHIEEGLNLDGISIYPHNNTSEYEYPSALTVGDETYQRDDLVKVASEYGDFYLLQDNKLEDGSTAISIIKSTDGNIEFYRENDGKIWVATGGGIKIKGGKVL